MPYAVELARQKSKPDENGESLELQQNNPEEQQNKMAYPHDHVLHV